MKNHPAVQMAGDNHLPALDLFDHQDINPIGKELLGKLKKASQQATLHVAEVMADADCPFSHLKEIEISFVDDKTIAQVHADFMNIPGATDVITFHHGEVIISVETAAQQASDYGHCVEKELLLYVIHGLLHLAGYDDQTEQEKGVMNSLQEQILAKALPSFL